MPSSLIVGALVLAWLVVLVPMIARKRQEVARTADSALAARIVRRDPAPIAEEIYVAEPENGIVDDEEESTAELPLPETDLVETAEDVEANETPEEPEDAEELEDAEEADETLEQDEADVADADPELADPETAVDRDGIEADEQVDEDGYVTRPYRPGRGGYNAEAAELAAAAKYGLRRKIVLALFIAIGASIILGVAIDPVIYWVTGLVAVGLAGYLTYLRRQVRIENDIRARRAARQRLPEPVEDEYAEPESEAEPEPSTPRLAVHPGTTVVDHDDEDPAFADLDDPDVLPYRRAAGQ